MPYTIYLYNEIPKNELDLSQIKTDISKYCPFIKLIIRPGFIDYFYSTKLVESIAGAWNSELSAERGIDSSEENRIFYEKKAAESPDNISSKVIYNGWELLSLLQIQIQHKESSLNNLHLFLTPRLLITPSQKDDRLHARTIIAGAVSIVSSSGLVEAPARPAEYYLLERLYLSMGQKLSEEEINTRFKGQFLGCHDPRLTQIIKGYIFQAIAYRFLGEGFCNDAACCLFNAHYQKEMLAAQLKESIFCSYHRGFWDEKFRKCRNIRKKTRNNASQNR